MVTDETRLLPLQEAVELETGRRLALSTVLRWTVDGRCGVRLRRQRLGGRWYTCRAWVREFIQETSEKAESGASRTVVTAIAGQSKARKLEADRAAELLRRKVGE